MKPAESFLRKIDLHMHTTASDGSDTPEELLSGIRKAGITLFSVTDHDSVKCAVMMRDLLTEKDPVFISGVEFSCKDEDGKYHILGYGYDPLSTPVNEIVSRAHEYRMRKVLKRLEFIKAEFGFVFPEEEIKGLLELDNPGKPHIANLMVKYGYAETKEQAIYQYINKTRFPSEYIRPEEAIAGILASGGVPVLAHPCYGSGDQLIIGEEMDERLRKLTGFGLEGVEVFYSGFTPKLREEMLKFAGKYGLYVTAGSDYHGKNKMIELGDTGITEETEIPEGLHRFIRRIGL